MGENDEDGVDHGGGDVANDLEGDDNEDEERAKTAQIWCWSSC